MLSNHLQLDVFEYNKNKASKINYANYAANPYIY